MKAIVITKPGGPEVLELADRPDPEPGPSEIRVRVRASALNRADVSQREGRYPAPSGWPSDIPGLEYAGEVDLAGDDVTRWKKGDHVMGIVGGGGHAEFVCVHERETLPMPRGFSFENSAAIPEVFLTAFDAIRQLGLTSGETLLIHAAGSGVGTAAIQLAKDAGITTIGTSRSAQKLERTKELGLDVAISTATDEWPAQITAATGNRGVDAILDLVGAGYLERNLALLAPKGRLISVGLTAGAKAELDMRLLMRKRLSIIGTVLRSRSRDEKISLIKAFAPMIPKFETGHLKPVIDSVMRFADIGAAHERIESNETFGKVVLTWS